jgi:hypothetical protein
MCSEASYSAGNLLRFEMLGNDKDGVISPNITLRNVGQFKAVFLGSAAYGSYIPNTPTKLGFYSSFIPKIVYDEYYVNPDYFILGHDGSLTRLYGEYKDNRLSDFRDRVLFEFECRIYNNLKASNTFPITQDDIIPGYFRKTEFNYDETLRLYSINFLNWVGKNRIDYKSQYFDKTNSYTYNYYQSTNRLDNKIVPRGNWRGLYNYFFDTSTPNLTPWEMLGYTDKPTWWDVRYGQSPYTIDNDFLWTDIENGYDYNGGNPRTIESRKRPGVKSILPVDSMGNLVDPLNSVIGNFDSLTFNHDWKTGRNRSSQPRGTVDAIRLTRRGD